MLIIFFILLSLGVIYGVASIILGFIRKSQLKEMPNREDVLPVLPYGIITLIGSIVFLIIINMIVVVDGKDVGIVITPKGVSKEPIHAGWNPIAPWNHVEMMDKTVWVYSLTDNAQEGAKSAKDAIWAPTKDGIKMGFDISVSWQIDENWAPWIFQNVDGQDIDDRAKYHWIEENIVRVKTKSALASATLNYTPIEVYSNKREDIQRLTQKKMEEEFALYHLLIKQVDIREIYYNSDYEKAINAKKLAEQEVLRLIEVTKQKDEQLKQAVINKNMAIEQAKGEAEALKIKGESITANPQIVSLQWIERWDGALPQYMMGDASKTMLMINPSGNK